MAGIEPASHLCRQTKALRMPLSRGPQPSARLATIVIFSFVCLPVVFMLGAVRRVLQARQEKTRSLSDLSALKRTNFMVLLQNGHSGRFPMSSFIGSIPPYVFLWRRQKRRGSVSSGQSHGPAPSFGLLCFVTRRLKPQSAYRSPYPDRAPPRSIRSLS
jgi:hypothetical protein